VPLLAVLAGALVAQIGFELATHERHLQPGGGGIEIG